MVHSSKKVWAILWLLVIILSSLGWIKFVLTGNILVDHNPYPKNWSYPIFLTFLLSLTTFCVIYWRLIWHTKRDIKFYKTGAYIVLILSTLMLPYLSNDVIIYLGHGDLSNQGIDVFSQTNILKNSIWAPYIVDWKDGLYVYGPITLIPAKLANWIGGNNIYLIFSIYKLLMLLLGIGIVEILLRIVKTPNDLLVVILAPAVWLHNIGHAHNDLIACFLIFLSILFIKKERHVLSAAFMGLALACKISAAIYLPFLLIYPMVESDKPIKHYIFRNILFLLVFVITLAGSYAIFFQTMDTLTGPFKFLSNQQPSKSFAEVTGEILHVIFGGMHLDGIENEVNKLTIAGDDPKIYWWRKSQLLFNIIGLLLFVTTTSIFAVKTKFKLTKDLVIEYFTKVAFIFFFFYLHIFQAWYLILLTPFISIISNTRIKKYFMILACYSGVHTIIITIARPSSLYYVLPVLVLFNVLLFLWQFRKNYLMVESEVKLQ